MRIEFRTLKVSVLSDRLQNINTMFGQNPDLLEDVWVEVAQNNTTLAFYLF